MKLRRRTDIASIWGNSPSWLKNLTVRGGALRDAVSQGKIDIDSAAYRDYCRQRGVHHNPETDRLEKREESGEMRVHSLSVDDGTSESAADMMYLRLIDIVTEFGKEDDFSAWLKDAKTVEDIREKRLKNEQMEGSLVSREGVRVHLLGLLEELSTRLLQDGAKTITQTVYSDCTSKLPLKESERKVRDMISKNLQKARDGVKRKVKKL